MANLTKFMKANKIIKEDEWFAVTDSLLDENGEPLKWRLRHITSDEFLKLRKKASYQEQITGKPGQYVDRIDEEKLTKLTMCAAVVEPDLNNAELQDSYGVKTPEDLIGQMVDDPGENARLSLKITKMSGLDRDFSDIINDAKN